MKRGNWSVLFIGMVVAAVIGICHADVVTIYPSDDTHIDERVPGTNYGQDVAMLAGPAGSNNDCIVFVKFPISQGSIPGVPVGSTITSVFLKLIVFTPSSGFPNLYCYKVNAPSNWTENNLTWNSPWNIGPSSLATGVHYTTPNAFQFQSSQMTSLVTSWYNGSATNLGFAVASTLNQGSTQNIVTFYTSENSSNRPYITIFYDPPPDPAHLTWTPTSHDFGSIEVGQSSPTFVFTLTNDGGQSVSGTIGKDGTNLSEFSIQYGNGSYTLAPGASRAIGVKFEPTSTGNKSAYLYATGANAPQALMTGIGIQLTSTLNVSMIPLNPPIIIPANGGSFEFVASVQRVQAPQSSFYVWARDRFPNGTYSPSLLGPVNINPPVGVNITRIRTQQVDWSWESGIHWYIGYAHLTVSYPATDADSFSWIKSTTIDGSTTFWDALCYGEPFPGEEMQMAEIQPTTFLLHPCSPNPFNPATTISYKLQAAGLVSLNVYNTAGRLVATLAEGWREAGAHTATFDGSRLPSGLYFARLTAGNYTATQKLVLLK